MIFDEQTNDFVYTVSGDTRAWIGAHRAGPLTDPKPRNDQWTWIDGSAMEFSNWAVNQPDHANEYCLEMINGQWNDFPCYNSNNSLDMNLDYFICQI